MLNETFSVIFKHRAIWTHFCYGQTNPRILRSKKVAKSEVPNSFKSRLAPRPQRTAPSQISVEDALLKI